MASSFSPDPDQERVLAHDTGALLVTGGPGTGKTELADQLEGIRYLNAQGFVDPARIGSSCSISEIADAAVRTPRGLLDADDPRYAEALFAEHAASIDVLVTDVIMPGMNGQELAHRIVSLRPRTKVLFMSGYTENAIGHNGTLDPGIVLLQKPFTFPALKAKVREVLDTPIPTEVSMATRLAGESQTRRQKLSPFRAQRFNLQLPLRYRLVGDNAWREGTTENISRSGMLFRAEELIPTNVQLEINLVLPAEIAGLSAAEVVCRGEIVRAMQPEQPTMSPAVAAKILQYHFQHGSQIPEA